MTTLYCDRALLTSGWTEAVRLTIADGVVSAVETGVAAAGEPRAGCVIPGIGNAHSHAFQRALSGLTERASSQGRDSFWTWRERMYAFAGAMTPERLHAIARQAYVEMLSAGYTAVAEFHYLHREPDGGMRGAMFDAIRAAADDSGIRLTYVPVLYERAGFDRPQPEPSQALFTLALDEFLAHAEHACARLAGRHRAGIGAHSLRAVSAESLAAIAERARSGDLPLHIHVAEQQREVDQCLAFRHRRPVRWLLENLDVDERWCLVHATHIDAEEVTELAASGAVVALCPSTEGNLGDGLFPLADFLAAGGRIAIGSDSHVSINPFEELRWLEYGQRLAAQARNVAISAGDSHVGSELFQRAVAGGAQACGQSTAGLATGCAADLVCLDADDPMLIGHDDRTRLDALVFSGYALPIDRVMVAGQWCVVDGEHIAADESRRAYGSVVTGIARDGDRL